MSAVAVEKMQQRLTSKGYRGLPFFFFFYYTSFRLCLQREKLERNCCTLCNFLDHEAWNYKLLNQQLILCAHCSRKTMPVDYHSLFWMVVIYIIQKSCISMVVLFSFALILKQYQWSEKLFAHFGCLCFSLLFIWSEIRALVADMLDLPFGDECFDVVVEKGTMVSY